MSAKIIRLASRRVPRNAAWHGPWVALQVPQLIGNPYEYDTIPVPVHECALHLTAATFLRQHTAPCFRQTTWHLWGRKMMDFLRGREDTNSPQHQLLERVAVYQEALGRGERPPEAYQGLMDEILDRENILTNANNIHAMTALRHALDVKWFEPNQALRGMVMETAQAHIRLHGTSRENQSSIYPAYARTAWAIYKEYLNLTPPAQTRG